METLGGPRSIYYLFASYEPVNKVDGRLNRLLVQASLDRLLERHLEGFHMRPERKTSPLRKPHITGLVRS
jgi:hypothetical protein